MEALKDLVIEAAQEHSPDASTFEIQFLGAGIYAVAAKEFDEESGDEISVERYFMKISAVVV